MLLRKTCFCKALFCYEFEKDKEFSQPIKEVTKNKFCAITDNNVIEQVSLLRKTHRNLKQINFSWWHKNHDLRKGYKNETLIQNGKTTELSIVPGNDILPQ